MKIKHIRIGFFYLVLWPRISLPVSQLLLVSKQKCMFWNTKSKSFSSGRIVCYSKDGWCVFSRLFFARSRHHFQFLEGGNTLVNGLEERLHKELRSLAPRPHFGGNGLGIEHMDRGPGRAMAGMEGIHQNPERKQHFKVGLSTRTCCWLQTHVIPWFLVPLSLHRLFFYLRKSPPPVVTPPPHTHTRCD